MKPVKAKKQVRLFPWTPRTMEERALLWIVSRADDPIDWIVLEDAGKDQFILPAVAALRFYNRAMVRETLDAATKAVAAIRRFPGIIGIPFADDEKLVSSIDLANLEKLSKWLVLISSRLDDAEKKLGRDGWRFNPSTRKVSRIGKNRGRDLLGECVCRIYREKHSDKGNTFDTRRKISWALTPYFELSELSAKAGGLIYHAIYNLERSPK